MAERLYTIPVNDGFNADAECPICVMYDTLERSAVEFTMGPSYMEEDIRLETDDKGFCKYHMKMLLREKNRLGLALILKTHADHQRKKADEIGKKTLKTIKPASLLKKPEESELSKWAREKTDACFICDRINILFPHYLDTVAVLFKKDPAFREKFEHCRGFCQEHLGMLVSAAQKRLNQEDLKAFTETAVRLYTENMKRISEELDWFAVKFDYRYKDAPWKNSKDSIERAVTKTNGILPNEKEK